MVVAGILALLFVAGSLEDAYIAARPQLCPLAVYLPPEGVATRCERSGAIDFEIDFEARVSLAGAEAFQQALMKDLENPRIVYQGGGMTMTIATDSDLNIYLSWDKGLLSVVYYKY